MKDWALVAIIGLMLTFVAVMIGVGFSYDPNTEHLKACVSNGGSWVVNSNGDYECRQ